MLRTQSEQPPWSVSVRSPRAPCVCPYTTTWNTTLLPWPSPRRSQPVVKLPRLRKSSAAKRFRRGPKSCLTLQLQLHGGCVFFIRHREREGGCKCLTSLLTETQETRKVFLYTKLFNRIIFINLLVFTWFTLLGFLFLTPKQHLPVVFNVIIASKSFQILIEGSTEEGEIAIDDVTVQYGNCPVYNKCGGQ